MRKILISIALLLAFAFAVNAQAPITFKRTYGHGSGYNEGHSVVQLPDSGYIMAGSCSGLGAGASDIMLIRTDKNGIQQWLKPIGGLNVDVARSIKPTADGNYIVCGYTNSSGNGGYDVYVVKINSDGDTLFTKTYGGADWDFGYSIEPTTDGGYIIAGETYSYGNGYNDFYALKIDATGNQQWQKTFGTDTTDIAYQAIETYNGNFLIVGYSAGYSANNLNDVVVVRLAANGDSLRSVKLATTDDETAYSIAEAKPDSGYFVSGTSRPANSSVNNFMHFKVNKGDTITNVYIINNGFSTTLRSIIALNATDVVVAGYSHPPGDNNNFGLAQEFFLGDWYQWGVDINLQNKEEDFMQIIPTLDGGFCAVGTVKEVSPGLNSATLVKMGPTGQQASGVLLPIITIADNEFKFYPNPTTGLLNLQFKKTVKQLALTIYNALGQQVFAKNYTNTSTLQEDISAFDNGLYLIQIITDGSVGSQRLVVAK